MPAGKMPVLVSDPPPSGMLITLISRIFTWLLQIRSDLAASWIRQAGFLAVVKMSGLRLIASGFLPFGFLLHENQMP